MLNALIYCRVSTEEQAEKGYSLEAQEKFCREFAQNNGHEVVGVFRDEGRSGTTLDRPALKDALSRCQQDKSVKALLIQETDRLARNTKDHLTIKSLLRKAGVKIISVAQPMLDDSPEGNMIDTILASVNQFQSDINSRKTQKGLQEKFDQGWWPSWAPIGYFNVTLDNNSDHKAKKILKKDPIKWPLLKQGFKLYLTGDYSVDELNDILYEKGLRSRNGKKIPHSILTSTLKNPFYAGLMRWKGQEKMGNHEPMINIYQHHRINKIMDSHNLHRSRRRIHNFLLRGFVYCGVCGQRYTAEKHAAKGKNYYHCVDLKKHGNAGQYVEAKELEKQVEEEFKRVQFSREFIALMSNKLQKIHSQQIGGIESQKQILYNQKKAIEGKRDKAEEKLFRGIITDEDFVRICAKFKEELNAIQNKIYELDSLRDYDIRTLQEAIKVSRNIYRAYQAAPYELKRHYLGIFWEKFLVQNKRIVETVPTKIISLLLKRSSVIIGPKRGPSSTDIITLLKDVKYLVSLREKLELIKRIQAADPIPCGNLNRH